MLWLFLRNINEKVYLVSLVGYDDYLEELTGEEEKYKGSITITLSNYSTARTLNENKNHNRNYLTNKGEKMLV